MKGRKKSRKREQKREMESRTQFSISFLMNNYSKLTET